MTHPNNEKAHWFLDPYHSCHLLFLLVVDVVDFGDGFDHKLVHQ